MTTLKGRLLVGAALWTAGLIAILGMLVPLLLARQRYGHYPHMIAVVTVPAFAFHTGALVVLAVAFMVAGLTVVRSAVSPFDRIRSRLAAVREGSDERLTGDFPPEVQPLVDDLNGLLELREQTVRRALAKAADLAHGLKTPLAVLAQEADRAEAAGQPELSASIRAQVERMSRQADYHVAQARASAPGRSERARCSVRESADGLARALARFAAERSIALEVQVDPSHLVRGQREDLDEMLGNLLENACKFARSRVVVRSEAAGDRIAVTVEDDGPGLAAELWTKVLQRGVRADEAASGTGLGLAIVRDLADLYGGSVALGKSDLGGLSARLELPG